MSQLTLFPTPEPQPAKYGLFLAVFPDEHTARYIYELATKLRHKHRLSGSVRPLNHLHISLPCLSNVRGELSQMMQWVDRACQATADTNPSFEITFDRVLSFRRGEPMKQPLVLVGSKDGNAELRAFHRLLVAKLSGRGDANPKFTPHMTLLYDQHINEETVSPVVRWRATEIVLVLSHVGETKYDRLGCWMLGA